jgi:hypothetical protein
MSERRSVAEAIRVSRAAQHAAEMAAERARDYLPPLKGQASTPRDAAFLLPALLVRARSTGHPAKSSPSVCCPGVSVCRDAESLQAPVPAVNGRVCGTSICFSMDQSREQARLAGIERLEQRVHRAIRVLFAVMSTLWLIGLAMLLVMEVWL